MLKKNFKQSHCYTFAALHMHNNTCLQLVKENDILKERCVPIKMASTSVNITRIYPDIRCSGFKGPQLAQFFWKNIRLLSLP